MLRAAVAADFANVARLLEASDLPVEGVADQFGPNYVTEEGTGVAGIEKHGRYGLLRSVAVAPEERGKGLAQRLVRNRLDWAAAEGLSTVYLLTTTAETYFAKLGFTRVAREDVPAEIRATREFASTCPSSSIVMRREVECT
jgi:amino-acid N-acetyltransferase